MLSSLFYDLDKPSAYSSSAVLKRKGGKEFLQGEDAYTLHKKYRKTYPRRKVVGFRVNFSVHADLADFQNVKKSNDNIGYLLVVVDNYSRFVHVEPVKNKTGPVMVEATEKIIERMRRRYGFHCTRFITDLGTEFYNSHMKKLFKDNHIEHFSTSSGNKSCMAERMIRTLKTRLYRYFTAKNTLRWVDVIQKIATAVNNSVNRSIKQTPASVKDGDIDETEQPMTRPVTEFKVGDTVRISKVRQVFDKGYLPSWTEEIFIVDKIKSTFFPPYLKLRDLQGEPITGCFYFQEVQVVKDRGMYKIEKVLQKKRVNGKEMALVKWVGYPSQFNQWIPASDIVNL